MPTRLDEGPPPSTYAAQIVDNLENARERTQLSGSRTQLAQLFRAVLALDTNDLTDDETFETNLAINHRLIWTIVRGCLCFQGTANPFDSHAEVTDLARDGLAVIMVTVRRYPEVVFTSLGKDTTYAAPEGPLFVWVVPRLLTLLRHENESTIFHGARDLLYKMLEIKSASRMAKFRRQPVLTYLRNCVDDILNSLVQLDVSQLTDTVFNLPLIPSVITIKEACGEELLRVTSRVEADNATQALSIVVSCLSTVTEYLSSLPLSAGLSSLRWVVGCLVTSQPLLTRITANLQDENELSALFLKTVNATFAQISQSTQDSAEGNQLLQLLCLLVSDTLKRFERNQNLILSSSLQNTLCSSLHLLCLSYTNGMAGWRAYKQHLEGVLEVVLEDHILYMFEEDLQTLLKFTSRFAAETMEELSANELQSGTEAMRNKLSQLFIPAEQGTRHIAMYPPSKRQRKSEPSPVTSFTTSSDFRTIYLETVRLPQDASASLPQIISETLAELPETVQRDMIRAAGIEACKLSNSVLNGECQTCIGDEVRDDTKLMDSIQSTALGDVLACIIRIVQEQKSPSPRVQAMLALRRFLAHCGNTEYIDLRTSTLATWPLQSLKSSIRSLRIASVSAIVHVISGRISQTVLRANRVSTLDVLRSLSERDVTLQEISVMSHGRIAGIIQSEDEINLCLLRLVEFLGHNNSFVANLAYEELQRLCSHNSSAALRLFEPYWRTLATVIVKDLRSRPQICQMVCELLGISVSHFLKLTQFHTIPFLILRKQAEVLHRIAEANGPNISLLDICSNSEQLAVILAYILLQPSEDPEETIRSLLSQVSEDFASIDPQELLRSDPTRIAFELLQVASNDLAETKARARHGILVLAEKTQRKPNKKYTAVDIFFEESSLGIMQLLSEVVSQTKEAQPIGNRRRCVGAIEEMAIIAGYHLINALPQISACLRSAIEDKDLCNEAFRAWMTLINSIDSEDAIGTMVDPTFAIVAQHWNSFSTEIQQSAHDLTSALIKNHSEWIRDNVLSIPSLEGIPLLAKFESELNNIRDKTDPRYRLEAFGDRCKNDNATVVTQALNELPIYLLEVQPFIYNSVVSEQPDPSIGYLIKALLDVCVRFANKKADIAREAARCLGLVGCLDPAKIELPHSEREIFVLSDFVNPEETLEFAIFFLEEVLVKTFLAETDTRAQGLLAYAIQELLKTCGFEPKNTINKNLQPDQLYQRWRNMDEATRETLSPFLTSRYVLEPLANAPDCSYPIYSTGMIHSIWLRQIVFDLLGKGVGKNAQIIFSICRRVVRRQNIAIPAFLLPFITLHIIFQGTTEQIEQLSKEFLTILSTPLPTDQAANESLILCSQDVFRTLDYMSRWLQERKKTKDYWPRIGVASVEEAQQQEMSKLEPIGKFLSIIPAEIISDRAIECKNFSRAILHWEAHIRDRQKDATVSQEDMDKMYSKLQNIYNSIDEPDGIEGISPRIFYTTFEQMMLEHKKAGRWNALQGWYEVELNKHPENNELQTEFLRTLKETGQHDTLINEFTALKTAETSIIPMAELVIEAAWNTSRYAVLNTTVASIPLNNDTNFNIGIGRILMMLQQGNTQESHAILEKLRIDAVRHLSTSNIKSTQSCHDVMFKFQILSEVEELADSSITDSTSSKNSFRTALLQRVESLGAFPSEQQKLLSIQRAMIDVCKLDHEIWGRSTSWLRTAKLARQSGLIQYAFNAVFRAREDEQMEGIDMAYAIEDARLLWSERHHIKAIQNLRIAIEGGAFDPPSAQEILEARGKGHSSGKLQQNPLAARAHLLLAKWIDHAGQTQSETIIEQYRVAVDLHNKSEKGHYHLGRHYNKLLESEKVKLPAKQAQNYITGEMAKLVIENFLRSMAMGAKYVHQTLPRILTLWLELGDDVKRTLDASYGNDANFQRHIESQRQKIFKAVTGQMKKYIDRLPAYVFYTAFSQVLARICHPHEQICSSLVDIVARVVVAHPQQAMWSLLALIKSKKQENRIQRGKECWTKIKDNANKLSEEAQRTELVNLMKQGQRLSDQLLSLSNKDLGKRHGIVSLSNDLGFSHSRSSHCRLAIPVEAMLTASLPTPKENVRGHKAFPKDTITIDTFLDEVLVLNSLIKPKKVTIRGSNGKIYGILCKPKDDLRKDQRLLEFNSMITRLLKRDAQSSKRRLYIKTYAVTPLNEECGLIEWVENVRPLRDILLDIYKQRNVKTDYSAIKEVLDSIAANREDVGRFESEVLGGFPPVFRAWFTEMFPEPSAWFEARLRYTRSCAVMSMVGHVLGLGDRHGENILFQGENGGTLHVDFNCLFDKGLTFEKPERVPFRLTHNMVDAFGVYGYEGPFRKCCELSLGILRQHEHALMTILETFVHDPTTDFIGKKRKANPIVPDTPEGVLEAIRNKVRGLIAGESVPLSVEGHVQLLIQEATDPFNLSAMYIGWCAFL